MLPTTHITRPAAFGELPKRVHEPVNEVPIHSSTKNQIFYPVPESRSFTRIDAAYAMHPALLPIDVRVPHPELIVAEKARAEEVGRTATQRYVEEFVKSESQKRDMLKEKREKARLRHTKIAGGRRWDFVFRDMKADDVGKTGRNQASVGARYGVPDQSRKRGDVKIPTSVDT
jgi:hypothetical protein